MHPVHRHFELIAKIKPIVQTQNSMSKRSAPVTELRVESLLKEPSAVVGSFFNGLSIPNNAKFDLYKHKRSDEYAIHGETDTLDYNGESEGGSRMNDYIVGLYDPVKKNVQLYRAPLVVGRVTARSKRSYKGPRIKLVGTKNVQQRNALGEAFGTKKAKAAITNYEKNKIDADKLQDVEMDIIENVKESTQTLPTHEEIQQASVEERPTPKANVEATSVEDIYPISGIITDREMALIRVNGVLEEEDIGRRLESLPYAKSTYVNDRLAKYIASNDIEKLQLLYYASLLFGVHENRRVKDKETLMTRLLNRVPEGLVDGILAKFTIARSSQFGKSKDRSFMIDPAHEDKLLCYLLALILHIDSFMVDLTPLAHELNLKPTKLSSLFKALGATIKAPSVAQAQALNISKSAAASHKIATLKVPFKLPEMVRRGKRR